MDELLMDENAVSGEFENLTPYSIIDAVESALGERLTGFAAPLPSYINRVYELELLDGTRIVAKFYRPGRWSRESVLDEHRFVLDCLHNEVPVVAPLTLKNGSTLDDVNGIFFTVYPKRAGRRYEVCSDDQWRRLGALIGRMHVTGAAGHAENRLTLDPLKLTRPEVMNLLDSGAVTRSFQNEFGTLMEKVFSVIGDRFDDFEKIRIHADCHYANILDRMEQGIVLIDFDDMMNGPAVQDLWLILPDHINRCRDILDNIIDGYEQFCEFDYFSVKLIEPLRLLRIIYFLSWCARQAGDHKFRQNFPDWGTDQFWRREIADIQHQLNIIIEQDKVSGYY